MYHINKDNMKNYSIKNENIKLKAGIRYIIIDALYINEIRENFSFTDIKENIINSELLKKIKSDVFSYTYAPWMEYTPNEDIFRVDKIRKAVYESESHDENKLFCTDTSFIFFINKIYFLDFIKKFDYDKILETPLEHILELNIEFWNFLTEGYSYEDIASIVSPGMYRGIDFDGSGLYYIEDL
jgi:hypothetical protein